MKNYQQADRIQLVNSGSAYFTMLETLIAGARETLELQTYIFENDETGRLVVAWLKAAAQRGVHVAVMADAFGSNGFTEKIIQELTSAGVRFRFFSPLFSAEGIAFGRRLHHKIVVADGQKALVGGINIADKYNALHEQQAWLDYAVLIEGRVCLGLYTLCRRLFARKQTQLLRKTTEPLAGAASTKLIRFRRNDWLLGRNEIHRSYFEAIIAAQQRITLVASYFLPGRALRNLLRDASARGVQIQIILAGKSDVPVLWLAERYLYNFYLSNNIRIFHWNESVLHGKAMTVDGKWATIGSYNLNYLSHYLIEVSTLRFPPISIPVARPGRKTSAVSSSFPVEWYVTASLFMSTRCI